MKYLILAGGRGERLWPISTKHNPKQFLKLYNKYTLLQNTAMRVSKEKGSDIYVVTNINMASQVYEQIKQVLTNFDYGNIIVEPESKNTAPAIAYGCLFFGPDEIVVVLSADAYIKNEHEFNRKLLDAERIADNHIVTLGIKPTYPSTTYGYIEHTGGTIHNGFYVKKYTEKPDKKIAKEYVKKGLLWNAGIFVFKVKTLYNELRKHAPDIYDVTNKIIKSNDYRRYYSVFNKISIDYAIMEKSRNIIVIPADIGWDDIGSYKSLLKIKLEQLYEEISR